MAAQPFPELNLLLFNVSGDSAVDAKSRRESMKFVLDSVLMENLPNLFVLCQDKIDGPKHKVLCEKLGANVPSKKEAAIYYRHDTNMFEVTFLSQAELQREEDKMPFSPDNPFTTAQLMVCVLQTQEKFSILLCSWHGPYKVKDMLKYACFQRLMELIDRLKKLKGCDFVIIGGDFNIEVKKLQKNVIVGMKNWDVGVLYDYTLPDDREDKLDYVVYWPEAMAKDVIETTTIQQNYKRKKGSRPFDHMVVYYQLGDCFNLLAKRLRDITIDDGNQESSCIMTQRLALKQVKSSLESHGAFTTFTSGAGGMKWQQAQSILKSLPKDLLFRASQTLVIKSGNKVNIQEHSEASALSQQSSYQALMAIDRECRAAYDSQLVWVVYGLDAVGFFSS